MNRPYIFCHMMTSLDGKISGPFMSSENAGKAGQVFYDLAFGKDPYYKHQGWLSGRVTTDDNFTFYKKPDLPETFEDYPGDYIADTDLKMYYVSIDSRGVLGWQNATLHYEDTTAHVVEVLSQKATPSYKAYLRNLGISYIIAGVDKIDYKLAMDKLYNLFHIRTLMLGGGGVLNWSFIQAGMCDEISVVISASADGSCTTPALFTAKQGLSTVQAIDFQLKEAKVMDGDSVWLRYLMEDK